jgi:CMP-N,N'-diacetyllegionaminic acid synthase
MDKAGNNTAHQKLIDGAKEQAFTSRLAGMDRKASSKSSLANPEVLAIIPARGGSKGVPRKNARMLCGKPLVAYSIEAARQTPGITRVIVSTDDAEIAEISCSFGAEVPCLRPKHLAGDRSLIGEALSHLRGWLHDQGYRYTAQVTLYPTHPFRSRQMMTSLVEKLLDKYSQVFTVRRVSLPAMGFLLRKEHGLRPLDDVGSLVNERTYYRKYGAFFGQCHLHKGLPQTYHHLLTDPIEWVDIDTFEDFHFAEEIIRSGLYEGFTCAP